jgi:hypothetical protein
MSLCEPATRCSANAIYFSLIRARAIGRGVFNNRGNRSRVNNWQELIYRVGDGIAVAHPGFCPQL